jgi:hypothetical protein
LKGRKAADRATGATTGISGENSGVANLTPYKPGQSGNLAGRPQGDGLMRKRLMKSFLDNEKAAMAAMARRWGSTKHVQDMWELLARLEGEMTKEAGGASPLDPETFRAAARQNYTGGLGYAYALSGRIAEGIPLLEHALSAIETMGLGAFHPLFLVYLGEAYVPADRLGDALACRASPDPCPRARSTRLRGVGSPAPR